MSVWVGELELEGPPDDIRVPTGFDRAAVLLRSKGKPLGWVWLPAPCSAATYPFAQIRNLALEQCGFEITRVAFAREHLGASADAVCPPISVVVCTRDRPEQLSECLERLAQLAYPSYEVLVVDNAPTDDRTWRVARERPVRYIREDRPGLDWARNRGITEARHEIVAFVDDDARADAQWLRALARSFADPEVMAVTGLVLPAELETYAQNYFEDVYGGMGKGLHPRTIHRSVLTDRQLLWASGFGVGANMAFRRTLFSEVGAFDPALDVGTASRGGGDVEFLHRVVARGHLLRYEPEAIVWHYHRRELEALRRQLFNNGCSVVPYLNTCVRNRTVSLGVALSYLTHQVLGWWLVKRFLRPGRHSRRLVLWETLGVLRGILAYPLARRTATRLSREAGPAAGPTEKADFIALQQSHSASHPREPNDVSAS